MKKVLLILTAALVFFVMQSCSGGAQLQQHDSAITELNQRINVLETQLKENDKRLSQRELELESLRFEMGLLRKELLEMKTPSLNPEQSQTERLGKLIQEISNPDCDTKRIAFELRDFGKRAAVALLDALKNPDSAYRTRVEKTFSGLLSNDAAPFLTGALKDLSLRTSAARILGDLQDTSVLNELNNHLTVDNEDFVFAVAEAMVKLRDKRAVPTLIDYLKKTDLNKRAIAFNLLNKITGLTLDYKYYGESAEVNEGAKRWAEWWVKNAPSFIFPSDDKKEVPSLLK